MTFLANKVGGYFLSGIKSRYSGLFFFLNNKMFKIIDEIKSPNAKFFMPFEKNSFVVESDTAVELLLDIKDSFDNSEFGRIYEVKENKDNIIIKFTKDNRPALYLCLVGYSNYKKTDKWIKKIYSFDKQRNSTPFERYVYSALKLKGSSIILSVSHNEKKATQESAYVLKNLSKLKKQKKLTGLNQLLVKTDNKLGIYAGLPWFFQFWSRDELISTKALLLEKQAKQAKQILLRNLDAIAKDGRLPNQTLPLSKKTNADSIGWLFNRIQDCLNKFTPKEKKWIKIQLQYSIIEIEKNYMKNGLIYNNPKETWMDTEWNHDNRTGFRIEIQALFLNMLKLAFDLTKKKLYKQKEENMKKLVREKFWKERFLSDGVDDNTIRPNIFIAAYIYPELLTKQEWTFCFKNSLPKLWLTWGGLSTIEKSHPLFCSNHTGELPQSYHRGDSWFWINDLAAIVLHKTDKKLFKKYISKILKASKEEILHKGIPGQHAELSSANKLQSQGCLAQAWSNAMFIELMNELSS